MIYLINNSGPNLHLSSDLFFHENACHVHSMVFMVKTHNKSFRRLGWGKIKVCKGISEVLVYSIKSYTHYAIDVNVYSLYGIMLRLKWFKVYRYCILNSQHKHFNCDVLPLTLWCCLSTCLCSISHHLEPVGLFPNVFSSTWCALSKWCAPKVRVWKKLNFHPLMHLIKTLAAFDPKLQPEFLLVSLLLLSIWTHTHTLIQSHTHGMKCQSRWRLKLDQHPIWQHAFCVCVCWAAPMGCAKEFGTVQLCYFQAAIEMAQSSRVLKLSQCCRKYRKTCSSEWWARIFNCWEAAILIPEDHWAYYNHAVWALYS